MQEKLKPDFILRIENQIKKSVKTCKYSLLIPQVIKMEMPERIPAENRHEPI